MAGGPDRPGPSGGHFSAFSKMGSKNGIQKWGPKMGSNMGSKMVSENWVQNGIQKWGPKMVSKNGDPKGVQNGVPRVFNEIACVILKNLLVFDEILERFPHPPRNPRVFNEIAC